jgi:alpha-tubulin suppressor-like RCC1 family protein
LIISTGLGLGCGETAVESDASAAPGDATVPLADAPWSPDAASGGCILRMEAGTWHACLLAADGTLHCLGSNQVGELGDGTYVSRLDPAPVIGLGAAVTAFDTGSGHSCAVVGGEVWCWGEIESLLDSPTPMQVGQVCP